MTSDRQRRANAANARKSTGPRTARGRAVSSKNARTHGLTVPPPWDDVTRYYRTIMRDTTAFPDPADRDPVMSAALALAEAEAHLARCVEAERRNLLRMAERAGNGAHVDFEGMLSRVGEKLDDLDVLEAMLARVEEPWMIEGLKILIQAHPDRPAALHRRIRTLRRYRREAEARRRKALTVWLAMREVGWDKPAAGPV